MKTVIFAAGGTAGHVFMAVGIAQHLKLPKILITDERGAKYAGKVFDKIHILPIKSNQLGFGVLRSLYATFKIFRETDGVFFGCGAYTSLIVGLIAILFRRPIFIYQGDQKIGRANKFLNYFCRACFVSTKDLDSLYYVNLIFDFRFCLFAMLLVSYLINIFGLQSTNLIVITCSLIFLITSYEYHKNLDYKIYPTLDPRLVFVFFFLITYVFLLVNLWAVGIYIALLYIIAPSRYLTGRRFTRTLNRKIYKNPRVKFFFTKSLRNPKIVGVISRKEIICAPLPEGKFQILVLGSSLGSPIFDKLIPRTMKKISPDIIDRIHIVQQQSKNHNLKQLNIPYGLYDLSEIYDKLNISYELHDFVNTVEELPKAHLVISRAGWGTIADLITAKRASILIPWRAALDDHQRANALALGGIEWIFTEDIEPRVLGAFIENIICDFFKLGYESALFKRSQYLEGPKPDGGKTIAEYLNYEFSMV